MLRRLAPLLKLIAAAALVLLAIDVTLFRSGIYSRWIEPESAAGSVVRATLVIDSSYDQTRKNILVLGDSQVGEGFSAQLADAAAQRPDLHFLNGSVPGTHPRLWNYLLREVDPEADRFAAIVMMVDYDQQYARTDYVNYPLDISYATPLLRLTDSFDFPASFSAPDLHARALRAIWLPLQGLHDDARDLLAHPLKRLHDVRKVRAAWLKAVATYGGREGALPALEMDMQSGMPKDRGKTPEEWRSALDNYFGELRKTAQPQRQAANQAYLRNWVGRMVTRYRAHGVPVIVFSMPRGPWKAQLLPTPGLNPALSELRDAGQIVALPGDAFVELEKPEFFFDTPHLNSTGREKFSKAFATRIAPLVH